MNFADIWNTSQKDYYILFNTRTGIVRFFLLFEQYGVKTSFWDTQYSIAKPVNGSLSLSLHVLYRHLWHFLKMAKIGHLTKIVLFSTISACIFNSMFVYIPYSIYDYI